MPDLYITMLLANQSFLNNRYCFSYHNYFFEYKLRHVYVYDDCFGQQLCMFVEVAVKTL